jgi:predicted transcriptional regulator
MPTTRTDKQELLAQLEAQPDDASAEQILSELHYRAKIQRGLRDLERGRTVSNDEVMEHLERWLKSVGR